MKLNSKQFFPLTFAIYSLLFAVLTVPLWYTPFTYFAVTYGKTLIFTALIEIILLLVFFSDKISKNNLKKFLVGLNNLDYAVIILVLILSLTTFLGVDVSNSFWGNQARATGLFVWWHLLAWYFLSREYFGKENKIKTAVILSGMVCVVVALSAIFPSLLPSSLVSGTNGRLSGILGNPAFLGNYLVYAVFLCALAFNLSVAKWQKFFWIVGLLLSSWVLFNTGTRGPVLGAIIGLATFFGFLIFSSNNKKVFLKISLAFSALVVGVVILSVYSSGFKQMFPKFSSLLNVTNYSKGTGQTRLMAWGSAWQGIKARPLIGWGPENYDVVYSKYYNPQFLKFTFAETVWDKPHNWLLEIGVAGGLLAILSYLAVYVVSLYLLLKVPNKSDHVVDNIFSRALLAGVLLASFVSNLFLFETINTFILWFIILAFISARFSGATTRENFSVNSKLSIAGVFLFAVFVFISLYNWHYLPIKMSNNLNKAISSNSPKTWSRHTDLVLSQNQSIKLESGIFLAEHFVKLNDANIPVAEPLVVNSALNLATTLENFSLQKPLNPAPAVWAGQVYMALGERVTTTYYADAERNLLRASAISPKKQDILFLLGRLYLLQKDFSKAYAVQERAISADPTIAVGYWFLGLTHIAADDKLNGLKNIELAIDRGYDLSQDKILYLIDTYASIDKYDKIIPLYQNLRQSDRSNPDWLIKLAATYLAAGQKDNALQTAQELATLFPEYNDSVSKFIKDNRLK